MIQIQPVHSVASPEYLGLISLDLGLDLFEISILKKVIINNQSLSDPWAFLSATEESRSIIILFLFSAIQEKKKDQVGLSLNST